MTQDIHQFAIPAGSSVRLTVQGGNVVVRGIARSDGSVAARGGDVHVEQLENSVSVEVSGPATVQLPADTPLAIRGAWDDAVIQGLRGSVDLAGGGGDIVLRDLTGEVLVADVGDDLVADGIATLRLLGSAEGDVTLRRIGRVEGRRIEGDLAATEVENLVLDQVKGDAILGRIGQVSIERIEGDLAATRVGPLRVQHVGGDVRLAENQGSAELTAIEGDLIVNRPGASVQAPGVEGDLRLQGAVASGATYGFQVRGDALIAVSGAVRLTAQAGGELRSPQRPATEGDGFQRFEGVIGEGQPQAEINVVAEGDIRIHGGRGEGREPGYGFDRIAREVEREVRRAMADVERSLAGIERQARKWDAEFADRFGPEFAGRFSARFRDFPPPGERARRRSRPWRAALTAWLQQFRTEREGPVSAPPEDLSEETLAVLRMVQEGKITAEEAEKLLDAMGA